MEVELPGAVQLPLCSPSVSESPHKHEITNDFSEVSKYFSSSVHLLDEGMQRREVFLFVSSYLV